MSRIIEIYDKDVGEEVQGEGTYKVRRATRVYLQRADGKIAILYNGNDNYHKFVGGGIDDGEELFSALRREVREEAGCDCYDISEVGCIIEYRTHHNLLQVNLCFIAKTNDTIFSPEFTQEELDNTFELRWYDEDNLSSVFANDLPKDYVGKFVQFRTKAINSMIRCTMS